MFAFYCLYYKPFIYKDLNYFEAFNQATIAILSYLVTVFTDYTLDSDFKYEMGKVWIVIFMLNYFISAVYLLVRTIVFFVKNVKDRCQKSERERRMIYKKVEVYKKVSQESDSSRSLFLN